MNIRFRDAGPADIPLIQNLSRRIWREHYPGIISRAQIEYMLERMYSAARLRDEMMNEGYRYVMVSDLDKPIGYLSYRYHPEDTSLALSKIYLRASYRAKGIGRRMLQYTKEQAVVWKATSVFLFVNRHNRKAIGVYERFGFRKTAETVADIGGGFVMDDYRMELRITG